MPAVSYVMALLVVGCGSDSDASAGVSGVAGTESSGGGGAASPAGGSGGESVSASGTGGGSSTTGSGGTSVDPTSLEPPAGEYGMRAELLEGNSEAGAAQIGDRIYVVGGYPSSRLVQSTVQVYDATTDAWELAPPIPVAIHHPMVAAHGDLLYVFGGETGDGRGPETDLSHVLDPSTGTWTPLPPMPTPRSGGAAAVIDDRVYVVGGRPPAGNAHEVYDVSDGTWTELARPSATYDDRNHLVTAAIGGLLYLAGGRYDGGGFTSPMTDALEVYDPSSDEWRALASMPRPRGGVNGIAAEGCFHVFGGEGGNIGEPNDVFPDHDVYDPTSDTWTSLSPLPIPVHGITGAGYLDGLIHLPGGGTQVGGSSGSVHHQVYRVEMRCN